MTIKEAAKKWGVSQALVASLCRAGRIEGATKREEPIWNIPDGCRKPENLKRGRKKPNESVR